MNIEEVVLRLKKEYPKAKIALNFKVPHELLIATILSAQCTDERVNKVTTYLFKKYKHIKDYANASLSEFERDIKPTGFYKNKARNIINACKIIMERFKGKVPNNMEDLMSLPGVARKTANIVLHNAYGIIEGIPVDTHVRRLSIRLGLSLWEEPNKIEADLMKKLPKKYWRDFSYLLIEHGRRVCNARSPKCDMCCLNDLCPSNSKK